MALEQDAGRNADPKPGEKPAAQPVAKSEAPFDTSLLPSDSELILFAQVDEILSSSLVQDWTGGRFHSLNRFLEGLGVNLVTVQSIRIGIRKLDDVPTPSAGLLAGGLGRLSLFDLATHPDVSSTLVIRSADRIEPSNLAANSQEVAYEGRTYYRLDTSQFLSPCAYVVGRRSLVVSNEQTIQSLILAGPDTPRPTADLSFVRKADFVVAVVPQKQESLHRWIPSQHTSRSETTQLSVGKVQDTESGGTGNVPEQATTRTDIAQPNSENRTDTSNVQVVSAQKPISDGSSPANAVAQSNRSYSSSSEGVSLEEDLQETDTLSVLRRYAQGIAFQLDLDQGVKMSISARCATPGSADQLVSAVDLSVNELKESLDRQRGTLPLGFGSLIQGLRADASDTLAFVTTAIPEVQQNGVLQLPGFLLGMASSADTNSMTAGSGLDVSEQSRPRELAELTLVEGIPSMPEENRPESMQLRALARWRPMHEGLGHPKVIELAVVAFGGPALNSVAIGHLELESAELNRLTPLKWVGTSLLSNDRGLDPLTGFVPVARDSLESVHPKNGVVATFDVVPPSEASEKLRRFAGEFRVRYFDVTEQMVLPSIRQMIHAEQSDSRLVDAGVEVGLGHRGGREEIEIFYDQAAGIGNVELLLPDGTPVPEARSEKTINNGQVLQTLFLEEQTLPSDVGLRIAFKSELREMVVPFEFRDLPLPDMSNVSESQRALLVWTTAETPSELSDKVHVEAQARWDNPDVGRSGNSSNMKPRDRGRPDDEDDFGSASPPMRLQARSQGRPPSRRLQSLLGRPLRIVVDLTGPLVEAADAVGFVELTSIATASGSAPEFIGAYYGRWEPADDFVPINSQGPIPDGGPPGGIRLAYQFIPPLDPIHELVRFNGTLKLRVSRNGTDTLIGNIRERTESAIINRELAQRKMALAVDIVEDQVLVRVQNGRDEQVSRIIPVDIYGDPIPGVTVSNEQGKARAEGRLIHVLTFSNGVPSEVGLRVFVNSSVNDVSVPFRLHNIPVPPPPRLTRE